MKLVPKIALVVLIGAGTVLIYYRALDNTGSRPEEKGQEQAIKSDKPQIVTTEPDLRNIPFVAQDQIISVTFNRPVENPGEFKHLLEPKTKYRLEASQDRKTIKIIPEEPYQLGVEYTFIIKPETKFDGAMTLGEEKILHFRTIQYRGI